RSVALRQGHTPPLVAQTGAGERHGPGAVSPIRTPANRSPDWRRADAALTPCGAPASLRSVHQGHDGGLHTRPAPRTRRDTMTLGRFGTTVARFAGVALAGAALLASVGCASFGTEAVCTLDSPAVHVSGTA